MAFEIKRSVAYICPSPAAYSDPAVSYFYMSYTQSSERSSESHTGGYIDTPAFYDSLSKIWLTKYALRELDRRNAEPPLHSSYRRAHQPATRNFLAEVKKRRKPAQSVGDFLHNCTPKILKDLKSFSRQGGPDMSDIRGHPEPSGSPEDAMRSEYSGRHSPVRERSLSPRTEIASVIGLNRLSRHSRVRERGLSSGTETASIMNLNRLSRPSRVQKRGFLPRTGTTSAVTAKSAPADTNYYQKLVDGGIYPYGYRFPGDRLLPLPPGWEEIRQRLARPQPSLRFSEERYREFLLANARASNEETVKDSVLPDLLKDMGAFSEAQRGILFTNIDPIADGISQAKPDYYYGAEPELIHPDVRNNKQLSKHIIPSKHTQLPLVPNFFLEAKGPDGPYSGALRKACHYGALGARAMHSLETYGQDQPIYNNSSRTISSTYHCGLLEMYGHSVAQPNGPGTRPEYYMHRLDGWAMTGGRDNFQQGAIAFKNAMDMAREYRDAAVARANEIQANNDREENIEDEEVVGL